MNFKNKLQRLLSWWGNLRLMTFVEVTLLFSYAIFIFYIPFALFLPKMASSGKIHFFKIIESIIVAPIIETLIWQAGVIYIVNRFISKSLISQVVISAISFGLMHYYNITYIFFAVYLGVVFATAFVIYERKNSWSDAFLAVLLVHALRNALAITLTIIFNN